MSGRVTRSVSSTSVPLPETIPFFETRDLPLEVWEMILNNCIERYPGGQEYGEGRRLIQRLNHHQRIRFARKDYTFYDWSKLKTFTKSYDFTSLGNKITSLEYVMTNMTAITARWKVEVVEILEIISDECPHLKVLSIFNEVNRVPNVKGSNILALSTKFSNLESLGLCCLNGEDCLRFALELAKLKRLSLEMVVEHSDLVELNYSTLCTLKALNYSITKLADIELLERMKLSSGWELLELGILLTGNIDIEVIVKELLPIIYGVKTLTVYMGPTLLQQFYEQESTFRNSLFESVQAPVTDLALDYFDITTFDILDHVRPSALTLRVRKAKDAESIFDFWKERIECNALAAGLLPGVILPRLTVVLLLKSAADLRIRRLKQKYLDLFPNDSVTFSLSPLSVDWRQSDTPTESDQY